MVEGLILIAAVLCSYCGMAWFALAKQPHWERARGQRTSRANSVLVLHAAGAAALVVSLLLCLWVDHVSMASLVWVMVLTTSALLVAFTLAWRPRWLGWLVAWMS